MPEFQEGQRVRVREDGGSPATQPASGFLGKEGTVQYGTGNLEGGPPTFYFVEFDKSRAYGRAYGVMAISPDWLEPR